MSQKPSNIEDSCVNIKMYFTQITLLIEKDARQLANFLTLRELAESGINELYLL